jgi:hypothetical protein
MNLRGASVPSHHREHDNPRRVLIISYHFPPHAASGAIRIAKFSKSWSEHGISVAVVSGPPRASRIEDASLQARLPASLIRESPPDPNPGQLVHRLRVRLPRGALWRPLERVLAAIQWLSDRVAIVDNRAYWVPGAVWRALRIARRFPPDLVLVSGPPFSAFVAAALVSTVLRVPLVLDYRDPWMTSPMFRRASGLAGRVNSYVERRIAARAAGITSAHRFILREIRALSPNTARRPRLFWVPNGYDPEDFVGDARVTDECFTINYAGAIYGTRQPTVLLQSVGELLDEGALEVTRFRLRFVGRHTENVQTMFSESSLLSKVVQAGSYLPHRDSVRQLQESTVNLVLVGPRAGPTLWTPAKLYENLFAGRPLLLLSPDGVPTRLARRSGGCRIAHPEDKKAIKHAVRTLYEGWARGDALAGPDRRRIAFFDRNHQARRFLRFLSALSRGSRRDEESPTGQTASE